MNRYCLWCDEEIVVTFSWESIITKPKPNKLCERCDQEALRLTGDRCSKCGRISLDEICSDCNWWNDYFKDNDPLQYNVSIYQYNNFFQDIITMWKYRGDYILIEAFMNPFKEHYINRFAFLNNPVAIPIPLSEERLKERGFNQAEQLALFLPIPIKNILFRNNSEKQAKKSRHERIGEKNPFKIKQKINNPVILVDDIYTTGATIRHAATILKEAGCPHVYSYTLIRG